LILDEPTNHLDIESREALVEALTRYSGAVILVSHDMHLLSMVADRLWLVKDGRVNTYDDDLQAYRKMLLTPDTRKADKAKPPKPAKPKITRDQMLALYEDARKGELETWNRKYAEVRDALKKAESLWMVALEKLDAAQKS